MKTLMASIKHLMYGTGLMTIILLMGACMNKTKPTTSGTVIILNGPSSVGKTSIIKAFQAKQSAPWLSTGIDNFFVGVLPPKFYLEDQPEHRLVMHGVASEDKEGKLFTLDIGPEGQKVIKGMHRAIAVYAHAGNNVIVDYIQYDPAWIADLKEALHGVKTIWVGVTASLASIQQREKKRGTSPEGHARSHYHTVHQGITYDLMIDTDVVSPEQSADQIIKFLGGSHNALSSSGRIKK
jgi:chloramphenicol 3-O phosphotransferase